MGSHIDSDHKDEVLRMLKAKAEVLEDLGKNRIANGRVVRQWDEGGVRVQEMPEDDQGVMPTDAHANPEITPSEYCNFRGDQSKAIALVERCLAALKSR